MRKSSAGFTKKKISRLTMTDVLGKEIVGYEEALYLKEMGFNNECTGYYHCDEYYDEEG